MLVRADVCRPGHVGGAAEGVLQRRLAFASAYVFMQVGRTLFFLWAVRGERVSMVRNFQRILVWLSLSAVFWIAGALADGDTRLGLWITALAIEFVSPALFFRVPGLGRSTLARTGMSMAPTWPSAVRCS
jgi:low temperature requirement protein LtrA